MYVLVWQRNIVAGHLRDVRTSGRHDLGAFALVVGRGDRGHRVDGGRDVRMRGRRGGEEGWVHLSGICAD